MIYIQQYNALFPEPEVKEPKEENYVRYGQYFTDDTWVDYERLHEDRSAYNQWLSSRKEIVGEHKWKDRQQVKEGVDYRIDPWHFLGMRRGQEQYASIMQPYYGKVAIPINQEESMSQAAEQLSPSLASHSCTGNESIEHLLKPRYRCLIKYPKSVFNVGEVLTAEDFMFWHLWHQDETIEKYPDCFKRLEWWEERATEEMPQYLKSVKYGHLIQVAEWEGFNVNDVPLFEYRISSGRPWTRGMASEWLPATQEEYNAFISQQPK